MKCIRLDFAEERRPPPLRAFFAAVITKLALLNDFGNCCLIADTISKLVTWLLRVGILILTDMHLLNRVWIIQYANHLHQELSIYGVQRVLIVAVDGRQGLIGTGLRTIKESHCSSCVLHI